MLIVSTHVYLHMIFQENITATTGYISLFRAYCNLMKALNLENGHNQCVRPCIADVVLLNTYVLSLLQNRF